MAQLPARKAAQTRKRRAAGKKAAQTRTHRAAGKKAAQTRSRRAAGKKAAQTRSRRAATAAGKGTRSAAVDAPAAAVKQLRRELTGSFKNRALLYFHFFDEMRKAIGETQATDIMKKAIYDRGLAVGKQFSKYAPSDMTGIRDAFLKFIPDNGALFGPEVQRCDASGVDIKFHRCPLKEAWQEAGVSETDMAKLCHIAGRVDNGTFEGAGFEFSADTWAPGRDGCCHLHIRPGRG